VRRLHFALMWLLFSIRDVFRPPGALLRRIGLAPGMRVLDFGCGPGGFSLAAARIVGRGGIVYALDISPLAVERVRRLAARMGLSNVRTILSGCATGLPDGSVDLVLLYDTLHLLPTAARERVKKELRRVLASGGSLSVSDHHMHTEEIVSAVTSGGLFAAVPECGEAGTQRGVLAFRPV